MLQPPPPADQAQRIALNKGPNIESLPDFGPLPDELSVPLLLKLADDVSTDEILPAGTRVLPYRSNIPKISEFLFEPIDDSYPERARAIPATEGHAILAGENYGQGSSREHAALAARYVGLRLVIARSFARIHWQNLINFGVLPVTPRNGADLDALEINDRLHLKDVKSQITSDGPLVATTDRHAQRIELQHQLSPRQVDILLCGGLINWLRRERSPVR